MQKTLKLSVYFVTSRSSSDLLRWLSFLCRVACLHLPGRLPVITLVIVSIIIIIVLLVVGSGGSGGVQVKGALIVGVCVLF